MIRSNVLKAFFAIIFLITLGFISLAQNTLSSLNSPYDERNPVISPDGKTLYYILKNHPENIGGSKDEGDIWYAEWVGGSWQPPKNMGLPLNNKFFNGVIGFLPDGSMLLYNHYPEKGGRPKTQGISITWKTSSGWEFPKALQVNYFLNKSDEHGISISADGSIMVLSLQSYGSYGAEDLYVSFLRPDQQWSQPRSLGYTVNTENQELTPWLAPDNRTLYFASNGYEGFGSRDIFVTHRLDDTWKNWSLPQNLGDKINSKGMELSFTILNDEQVIFMTTQNSDGYGDLRIRPLKDIDELAPLKEPISEATNIGEVVNLKEITELKDSIAIVVVTGKIVDAQEQKPVAASLSIINQNEIVSTATANPVDGNYTLQVTDGTKYKVEVKADGYLTQREELDFTKSNPDLLEVHFQLYPIKEGVTVNLNHVHFYQSTADLIESSYEQLDLVAQMMLDNPEIKIDLAGHTDNRGVFKLNVALSNQRVEAVKKYLVKKGIASDRISGKGYGGTRPIASNETEQTRKLNRRVEFTIL